LLTGHNKLPELLKPEMVVKFLPQNCVLNTGTIYQVLLINRYINLDGLTESYCSDMLYFGRDYVHCCMPLTGRSVRPVTILATVFVISDHLIKVYELCCVFHFSKWDTYDILSSH